MIEILSNLILIWWRIHPNSELGSVEEALGGMGVWFWNLSPNTFRITALWVRVGWRASLQQQLSRLKDPDFASHNATICSLWHPHRMLKCQAAALRCLASKHMHFPSIRCPFSRTGHMPPRYCKRDGRSQESVNIQEAGNISDKMLSGRGMPLPGTCIQLCIRGTKIKGRSHSIVLAHSQFIYKIALVKKEKKSSPSCYL